MYIIQEANSSPPKIRNITFDGNTKVNTVYNGDSPISKSNLTL
jgi:hypothetical protein